MVLLVVTKGRQEALIPLAPIQKLCTGTRALLISPSPNPVGGQKIPPFTNCTSADVPSEPSSILAKC